MKPKAELKLDATVVKLVITEGKIVALSEKDGIHIIDSTTLDRIGDLHAPGADFFRYANSFDISKDGRYVAYGVKGQNKYVLLDVFAKKKLLEAPIHSAEVYAMKFSNDGKYLASGGMDGKSFIFDFESKKFSQTYNVRADFVSAFAFTDDGQRIAIASYDTEIRIHKINDYDNYITLKGFEEPIVRLEFVGQKLLIAFYRNGAILVFDYFAQHSVANPKKLSDGVSAFFEIDGYAYICGRERNIRLLNAKKEYVEESEAIIKGESIVTTMDNFGDNTIALGMLDGTIAVYELDSDNKELENLIMNGDFGAAYQLIEENPFLKNDENFIILEEAWQMTLIDIAQKLENNELNSAKQLAASYMHTSEKRLILQTMFKQFEEFSKLKYAVEHGNHELVKSMISKNNYFKLTKLFDKIKSHS